MPHIKHNAYMLCWCKEMLTSSETLRLKLYESVAEAQHVQC